MLAFLTKRISTPVGIIILVILAGFAAWLIINQYSKIMKIEIQTIQIQAFGEE